jgi:Mg-chelatase subunit ChlD
MAFANWKLFSLLGVLFFLSGCPEPGLRDTDRARSFGPGKTLVVVIDVSGSMNENDPDRLSLEGSQLLAGLVDEDDNIGCIKFSTAAKVLAPLRVIKTSADRRAFSQEVAQARREGSTNYVAALRKAREMLEQVNAPAGATVLFMTDGVPNLGTREETLAEVDVFRGKGWKIQALGYGDEAATSDILTELATRTGGGVFLA